jgi:hypothetical protein
MASSHTALKYIDAAILPGVNTLGTLYALPCRGRSPALQWGLPCQT